MLSKDAVIRQTQYGIEYINQFFGAISDKQKWFCHTPFVVPHDASNVIMNTHFGTDATRTILITSDMIEEMQTAATRFTPITTPLTQTYRVGNAPREIAVQGLIMSPTLRLFAQSLVRMPLFPWTEQQLEDMRRLRLFDANVDYATHVRTIIAYETNADAAYANADAGKFLPDPESDSDDDAILTIGDVVGTNQAYLRRPGIDDQADDAV
jgi:hypothetical protein